MLILYWEISYIKGDQMMLVNRLKFYSFTFVAMIVLSVLLKNTILAGIITFIIAISSYIIIAFRRNKKRMNLLEEQCDPEAFLEATEKQRSITGKNPKINTYLNIDKAAGLITMGEFQKAKEILDLTDQSKLSKRNNTLLIYTINLILCLYELGEVSEGEKLFETKIPMLAPIGQRVSLSMKALVAERLFILNRFEESKESLQQLLNEKITKRVRLSILYTLARIEEKDGNIESAKEKFVTVMKNGNKLWIVEQSRQHLEYI